MVFKKWVIKRSNHYAYLGGRYLWWSFFLADSSSCSIDQKHPAAVSNSILRAKAPPSGRVWATLQKGPTGVLHLLDPVCDNF